MKSVSHVIQARTRAVCYAVEGVLVPPTEELLAMLRGHLYWEECPGMVATSWRSSVATPIDEIARLIYGRVRRSLPSPPLPSPEVQHMIDRILGRIRPDDESPSHE